MNFEKAYENYEKGIATDEERVYVEAEIAKARRLTAIIDELDAKKAVIAPTEAADVLKAKKAYGKKSALRIAIISLCAFIVVCGIVCAAVFGSAAATAKKNMRYATETETIATQFVRDNYAVAADKVVILSEERSLHVASPIKDSYYYYTYEVQVGTKFEVEVAVNAKTGIVSLIEIDDYD